MLHTPFFGFLRRRGEAGVKLDEDRGKEQTCTTERQSQNLSVLKMHKKTYKEKTEEGEEQEEEGRGGSRVAADGVRSKMRRRGRGVLW